MRWQHNISPEPSRSEEPTTTARPFFSVNRPVHLTWHRMTLFSILDDGAESFQVLSSSSPKKAKVQSESPPPLPGPSRIVDQRTQVDTPVPMQGVGSEDFAMTEGDASTGDLTATTPRFFPPKCSQSLCRM
jgi:hypothetical protein